MRQHQAVEERYVEPLTLAGSLAMQECRDDAVAGHEGAHGVDDGHAAEDRPAVRLAGDGHQPAHGLDEHVDSGFVSPRPRRPEGRERAVDDARIDGSDALIVDAQPFGHTAFVRLEDDVGGGGQG